MFKVFSKTIIKPAQRLEGISEKSVSLVRRPSHGLNDCLSVVKDGNLICKNFNLDEEWEAEEYYLKCVNWARQGTL